MKDFSNIDQSYKDKMNNIIKLLGMFKFPIKKSYLILKNIVEEEFFSEDIKSLIDNSNNL